MIINTRDIEIAILDAREDHTISRDVMLKLFDTLEEIKGKKNYNSLDTILSRLKSEYNYLKDTGVEKPTIPYEEVIDMLENKAIVG